MIDKFTRKFSTNDSHLQTEYPNIKLVLLMNVHVCIYLYTMICHDIYIVVIYTLYPCLNGYWLFIELYLHNNLDFYYFIFLSFFSW